MDETDLRNLFASLRGEERRLLRPPPDGAGGILMAEGARLVVHAQQRGHHLNALLVSAKYNGPMPAGDHGVLILTPEDIQRLTGFGAMREMLGAFDRPPDAETGPVIEGARSVLVLEGVSNPSNVGTIIRSAVALGMDATLVGPASSDPYGRRALRTSMGTALDHPWAPDPDPIATCRARGITTLALTPDPSARRLEDALAEHRDSPLALVLGAEGPGLTDATMAAADECVTIPMAPGIDSLNVAAAAAIACYLVASR